MQNLLLALLAALLAPLTPASTPTAAPPSSSPPSIVAPAPVASPPMTTPVATAAAATSSPAAAPAAVTTAPSCGTVKYKADGVTPWACTFAEDFNGTALNRSVWTPNRTTVDGYAIGNDDCVRDHSDNITVSGGTLKLTARRQSTSCPFPGGPARTTKYTGASISTIYNFSQTYGKWEFRAKMPATTQPGSHSALWAFPADLGATYGPWPISGEIDIAEFFTSYPDRLIPFLHYYSAAGDTSVTNNYCLVTNPTDWHTYGMEWSTTGIKITYDGNVCLNHTFNHHPSSGQSGAQPFDVPFFPVLTQSSGAAGNLPTAATLMPAVMTVDYVRVWQ